MPPRWRVNVHYLPATFVKFVIPNLPNVFYHTQFRKSRSVNWTEYQQWKFLYPHVTSYSGAGAVLGMSVGTVPNRVGAAVHLYRFAGGQACEGSPRVTHRRNGKLQWQTDRQSACFELSTVATLSLLAVENKFPSHNKVHFESLLLCFVDRVSRCAIPTVFCSVHLAVMSPLSLT